MQVSRREPKRNWKLYTFDFGTVGFVLQPSIMSIAQGTGWKTWKIWKSLVHRFRGQAATAVTCLPPQEVTGMWLEFLSHFGWSFMWKDDMKPWSQRHSLTFCNNLKSRVYKSLQGWFLNSPVETSRLQISECQSISNLVACSSLP